MEARQSFVLIYSLRCALFGLFVFLGVSAAKVDVQIQPISLDTVQTGIISSKPATAKSIFTNFEKKDPTQRIGLAEQRIFQFRITYAAAPSRVVISTCNGSSFDTHLVLFDKLPTSENVAVIGESANDVTCEENTNRATLAVTLQPSEYYFILTGNENEHGAYQVSLTSAIVNSNEANIIPWYLDRVDQRKLPLDNRYRVTANPMTITVYLLSTGVNAEHEQLQDRVQSGYDFVRNSNDTRIDCTGQGTHAASLIAGRDHGIVQNAVIIPLRVFDCNNVATVQNIVDAIYWILVHSQRNNLQSQSVITFMFSLPNSKADNMRSTMRQLVRQDIPTVVPAGDNATDACEFFPASEPSVLTVGAVDSTDMRPAFSNYGSCVDIYAPGVQVAAAWSTANNATFTLSGTSQAAAIATGAVVQLLSINPGISSTIVNSIISSVGTPSVVKNVNKNESANLLYIRTVPKSSAAPPPSQFVSIFSVIQGKVSSCAPEGKELSLLRQVFAKKTAISESDVDAQCQPSENIGVLRQTSADDVLEITNMVRERDAGASFAVLEKALSEEKVMTEQELGFEFDVVEMPWAVDSRGIVYWGAPSFPETQKWSVSAGITAAIIFIVVFVASGIGVGLWICRRRINKLDEIESMEGSADFDRGPARFNDYENDDSSLRGSRSFRSLKRGLSFRRVDTHSEIASQMQERGMNRMSSFLCAGPFKVAKDLVRLQSFGGEAFAGMTPLERSESTVHRADSRRGTGGGEDGDEARGSDSRTKSFRGKNNLRLWRLNTNIGKFNAEKDENDEQIVTEMRMKSVGGEAFAMVTHMPSLAEIRTRKEPETDAPESRNVREGDSIDDVKVVSTQRSEV